MEKLPTENELIGDYKLNIKPPYSVGPAKLILNKNNTFELKNVPIGVLDVFNSDYKQNQKSLQDITGKWKISNNDNYELKVSIEYNKIDSQLENIGSSWILYEQDKKPVILIILGDPDSCEALSFIKR
jgi:lipocalin